MTHLCLSILNVRTRNLQPRSVGTPKHLPVHPADTQLPCGGLDESAEYRVISHSDSLDYRCEHQVIGLGGFHCCVVPDGGPSLDIHYFLFELVNSTDYHWSYRNSGVACFAFGWTPLAAAKPFLDAYGVRVYVPPS